MQKLLDLLKQSGFTYALLPILEGRTEGEHVPFLDRLLFDLRRLRQDGNAAARAALEMLEAYDRVVEGLMHQNEAQAREIKSLKLAIRGKKRQPIQVKFMQKCSVFPPLGTYVPKKQTPGASGFDLYANEFPGGEKLSAEVPPHGRLFVGSGFAAEIPQGYEGQVRARSGLAAKHGITLANGIGTIDSDYRGEIGAVLLNTTDKPYLVQRGDRIAQLVICPVPDVETELVDMLDQTERGNGGFGSTGKV